MRSAFETHIWSEIESLWKELVADRPSNPSKNISPDYLHVEERFSCSFEKGRCEGQLLHQFRYDDHGRRIITPPFVEYHPGARRGSYWQIGFVAFHIPRNLQRAFFEFQVGPRYGRGWILSLNPQGQPAMKKVNVWTS